MKASPQNHGEKDLCKSSRALKVVNRKKATGRPKDLARSLGISERTLFRLINDVSELYGVEIYYSNNLNSYIIDPADNNDASTGKHST